MMSRASAEVVDSSATQSCLELLADVARTGKLEQSPEGAFAGRDFFKNWSRTQLKQYLNFRTGGCKKYASYSRVKLIDRLLALDAEKNSFVVKQEQPEPQQLPVEASPAVVRRLRKGKNPSRLPVFNTASTNEEESRVCDNAACRAKRGAGDLFCKRCSCCICNKFDDNKDPSLWMECSGEVVDGKSSCGLSCHIECALKSKAAGVVKRGETIQLDGSYSCPSCGYISSLLECWMKQLSIAKDARRVDVFSTRLSLAVQLFNGTARYKGLHALVLGAARDLEAEIGPVRAASPRLARGLVTRLSCGAHVQRLIEDGLAKAKSWPLEPEKQRAFAIIGGSLEGVYKITFEEVTSESVVVSWKGAENVLGEEVVGHSIWCRGAAATRFPSSPVCSLSGSDTKAVITGLHGGVEYVVKIVPFTRAGDVGQIEARCFTVESPNETHSKNLEAIIQSHRMFENGEIESTFKVREIAKLFHTGSLIHHAEVYKCDSLVGQFSTNAHLQRDGSQESKGEVEAMLDLPLKSAVDHEDKRVIHESQNSKAVMRDGICQQDSESAADGPPDCSTSSSMEFTKIGKAGLQSSSEENDDNRNLQLIVHPTTNDEEVVQRSRKRPLESSNELSYDGDEYWSEALMEKSLEFSIKVIVWLERQGYVKSRFRLKLLTWLGFRATQAEKKVVFVYIRTLLGDPVCLAHQLIDTFQEIISIQRSKTCNE